MRPLGTLAAALLAQSLVGIAGIASATVDPGVAAAPPHEV
jgi:hypothetical protein